MQIHGTTASRPTLTLRCRRLTIARNTAPLGVLAFERVRR